MKGSTIFAILNGLMGLVMVACAVIQINDPDPIYWMAFYALGALACLLFHQKRLVPAAAGWYGIFCVALALLWGTLHMMGKPLPGSIQGMAYEEEKEIGGFLLVGIWMAVLYFRGKRMGMK